MIRYRVDPALLAADIRAAAPAWFEKAAARTRDIGRAGRYDGGSNVWSEVKPALMRLQHCKCAYCERRFETPEYSAIEFDIEHFRPKGAVKPWPDPGRHAGRRYDFPTGAAYAGYFWLALELDNYAVACKVCNSRLKLNYFPIAGVRGAVLADIADLAFERPYLCNPIGPADEDDPEDLVTFEATTAVPAAADGHRRRRGTVIIDFFDLNLREQLHRERAHFIGLFGPALKAISDGCATDKHRAVLDWIGRPEVPHAGCLRAFRRLWERDAERASRIAELCSDYVISPEGSAPPAL